MTRWTALSWLSRLKPSYQGRERQSKGFSFSMCEDGVKSQQQRPEGTREDDLGRAEGALSAGESLTLLPVTVH